MAKAKSSSLNERVKLLVDRYWGGNVTQAAKHFGLSQQTLQRIYNGLTPSPRMRVVQQIVDRSPEGTTLDWLVFGRGTGPRSIDAAGRPITAGAIRLYNTLKSLALDPATMQTISLLPYSPMGMCFDFDPERFDPANVDAADYLEHGRLSYVHRAVDAIGAAWADCLESAIEVHGSEAVAKKLNNDVVDAMMGYSLIGMAYAADQPARAKAMHRWSLEYAEEVSESSENA